MKNNAKTLKNIYRGLVIFASDEKINGYKSTLDRLICDSNKKLSTIENIFTTEAIRLANMSCGYPDFFRMAKIVDGDYDTRDFIGGTVVIDASRNESEFFLKY
jgi:hypothetical protein